MALTIVDAGVVIAFLDADDAHHAQSHSALAAARAAGPIGLPASALAEVLVGPSRSGPEAVAAVRRFVAALPITVLPLDEDIAVDAARLRADFAKRLRLPDALVIATARIRGANFLLTTDRGWPAQASLGLPGTLVVV